MARPRDRAGGCRGMRGHRALLATVMIGAALAPLAANPAAHATTTVTVPAGAAGGVDVALAAGTLYRLTATGTFGYDFAGSAADAECTTHNGALAGDQWLRSRYAFIFADTPTLLATTDFWDPDPTDDAVDLYVDGRNVEWTPAVPSATGCDTATHTYTALYAPIETRPVNLRIFDIQYGDNSGALTVSIDALTPSPPGGNLYHQETVLVNSAIATGGATRALARGRRYLLVAHGMYLYDTANLANLADAECSRTPGDPIYTRHRYGNDRLDLTVNGATIEWVGLGPNNATLHLEGCDQPAHFYGMVITATGGPVTFAVSDTNYADNTGTLSVDVFQLA